MPRPFDVRPPKTLTLEEQTRLLNVTRKTVNGIRDHVIYAVALGTGLREHEIVALNVGDILHRLDGKTIKIKRRVSLRVFKRSAGKGIDQEVFLPDNLVYKLGKLIAWKRRKGESLDHDAPLFIARGGRRISTRTLRYKLRVWQRRARFDRLYTFHSLRHTALTNLYRATRDISIVQRQARHKDIKTTTIYAGPSDEEVLNAVRDLPC